MTREVMFCGLVVLLSMAALRPSELQIPLTYSDPGSLVTTAPISCSDQRCSWGVQYSNSRFSVQNNLYAYMSRYRDGNGISGFCVSDVLPFDILFSSCMRTQAFY
ncbi:hypothetical protein HID58_090332 [Brassica napus]|uniref:Uncharacterized protein n=1 Tax=Brassica napus TaxID=3708 RepID=A0ABQ7X2R7_BRANA|nr:hypothetical protein HID58_090332 [Brassica napus]